MKMIFLYVIYNKMIIKQKIQQIVMMKNIIKMIIQKIHHQIEKVQIQKVYIQIQIIQMK